jgi:sugar lactone lactonase YvrE
MFGSRVERISQEGKVSGVIHLPTRSITSCVFVDTDLFITSAKEFHPEKYPDSVKFAGNVFKVNVGVKGMPIYKARLKF